MPRGTDRYDEARLQGRLWDLNYHGVPAVFYANFSRLETLSFGTGIATARSLIGSVSYTQATGSAQPTLADLNGRRRIASFSAASNQILATASGITGTTYTICGLARMKSGGSKTRLFTSTGAGADNHLWGWHAGNMERWYANAWISQPTLTDDSDWHVMVFRSTAGTPLMRNNSATVTTSGSTIGDISTFQICTAAFAEDSDCEVFAFAAWNTSLPLNVIEKVEGAWVWEAGLTRILPASHPYKNRPPLIGD